MVDRPVVSDLEMKSVLKLDAAQRYSYFIKRVADWEVAWGLWDDGWALVRDDDGRTGLPLWPTQEFAQACALGEWEKYRPQMVALSDLIDDLILRLRDDGLFVGVFPTPGSRGMLVAPCDMGDALRAECERYQ